MFPQHHMAKLISTHLHQNSLFQREYIFFPHGTSTITSANKHNTNKYEHNINKIYTKQRVKPDLTDVITYIYLLLWVTVADSHSWSWDSVGEVLNQNKYKEYNMVWSSEKKTKKIEVRCPGQRQRRFLAELEMDCRHASSPFSAVTAWPYCLI